MGYQPKEKVQIKSSPNNVSSFGNLVNNFTQNIVTNVLSAVTFSSSTIITNILSANTISATTLNVQNLFSGGTALGDVIYNLVQDSSLVTGATNLNSYGWYDGTINKDLLFKAISAGTNLSLFSSSTVNSVRLNDDINLNTVSAATFYSGSTPLETNILNIVLSNSGSSGNLWIAGSAVGSIQQVALGNNAAGLYSFVVGQYNSTGSYASANSSILGGKSNGMALAPNASIVNGFGAGISNGGFNLIGNGLGSKIDASSYSTVLNGNNNRSYSTGQFCQILNGYNNFLAQGSHNTILGGYSNTSNSNLRYNLIGNGRFNSHQLFSQYVSVHNGFQNYTSYANKSSIGNGSDNKITGTGGQHIVNSDIINGETNTITGTFQLNTIVNGRLHTISNGSRNSTIVNGDSNQVSNTNFSTILNGNANTMLNTSYSILQGGNSSYINDSSFSKVFGQNNNTNSFVNFGSVHNGTYNTIAGYSYKSSILNGNYNTISQYNNYATILNGQYNYITRAVNSTIIDGESNTINNSNRSSILGGVRNTINHGASGVTLINSHFVRVDNLKDVVVMNVRNYQPVKSSFVFVNDLAVLNLSGNTIRNLGVSQDGSLVVLTATTYNSLSATTFYSGTTPLNNIFSLTSHTHSLNQILNTAHTHSVSEILSGGTPISNVFSLSSHTHTLAQILNTAHTHSVSEIQNLQSTLNTKADLSGITVGSNLTALTIFSNVISGNTFYSGQTPLSSVFSLSSHTHSLSQILNTAHTHSISGLFASGRKVITSSSAITEEILATVIITGGTLSAGDSIDVVARFLPSAGTGTKITRVRIGSGATLTNATSFSQISNTSSSVTYAHKPTIVVMANGTLEGFPGDQASQTGAISSGVSTVNADPANNIYIHFTSIKTSGDSMTLRYYDVRLFKV